MCFTRSYVWGSKADLRNIKASWSWFISDAFAFVSPKKTKSSQRPLGLFREYKFMIHDGSYFRIPLAFPYLISETKLIILLLILVQVHDHSVRDSRKMWAEGNPTKENLDLMNSSCAVFQHLYMVPPFGHVIAYKNWSCNATYGHLCAHVYQHSVYCLLTGRSKPLWIPIDLTIHDELWFHSDSWHKLQGIMPCPNLPSPPKKYTPNFQFLATTYCMFCSSCPSHVPRETYIDVFISEDLGAGCCDKDTQFRHKGCTKHSTV